MKQKYNGLIILLLLLIVSSVQAQLLKPAKWKFYAGDQDGNNAEIEVFFEATIDLGWYLYSNDFKLDPGPMLTEFEFTPHASYELVGDPVAVGAKRSYDSLWEGEYTYFVKKGLFKQRIKLLEEKLQLKGVVTGQVCSEENGSCIPFEEDFSIKGTFKLLAPVQPEKEEGNNAAQEVELEVTQEVDSASEIMAVEQEVDSTTTEENKAEQPISASDDPILAKEAAQKAAQEENPLFLLTFLLMSFLGGFIALNTPCVYPMIPMTVSLFTKKGKRDGKGIRKALFFGFTINALFTLIGVIVPAIGGPDFLNWISTHWLTNIIFFAVFVVFGLSFLGMFEIMLPSKWVNKVDRQADKGGYYGVFFMALTLVLVSFSCTVPIVGGLLIESFSGNWLKPVVGMFGFGLAFALPFTLFAIFPEWINSMPKSGGWLNSVKVVLGFVELGISLKFLSVADQAYHWGLLDRDIYLAFWIAILVLLALYLLGKIRMPHDSEVNAISVPRLVLACLVMTFAIYLVPGMFGAPLKALAGYLPPMYTHDFNIMSRAGEASTEMELCEPPKYTDFLHLPHGLKGYFDFDQALACAKAQNKPLFIDFTGHGCVNCREMEARVWSDPAVLKRLQENFVMVALYVDDKTTLPESDWYTSTYDDKVKKTIGAQNFDFQVTRFNVNAQPYYVILGNEGQVLVPPRSYDLDPQGFAAFLDQSVESYDKSTVK